MFKNIAMDAIRPTPSAATPRNVYAFGLTSLLNDTASEMAYWVLPSFLATIGAGPAQLGVIEGVAESVASIAKLFSGYLADRVSRRKPLVVAGYVVANAVKPLLALVSSWWQVLGIRFADRFAKGIRGTARDVMVAESVDSSHIGSAYGLIQTMDSAGAILGPLAALALIGHFGMRGVFWAAAVPGGLAILVASIGIRETRQAASKSRAGDLTTLEEQHCDAPHRPPTTSLQDASRASELRLPWGFYYVLAVVTLFSLGNSSDMFLVLRAGSIGIPVAQAPLLGLVFNITYTLLSWPAGKFSDRFSRSTLAAAGYFVFAIVYLVFALAPSRLAIWTTMAFYGLFYALTNPVLKALIVDTVAPEVRGRALGIYSFLTSVTTLLASVITGELWKVYGAQIPFYLSSAIAAVSAVLLLLRREGARSKQSAQARGSEKLLS
jgi:MFS family permease